jgi:peptidyl-prolyl cis-trans isomerase C
MVFHLVVLVMTVGLYGFGASELFPEEKILARVGEKVITQDDLNVLVKKYETFRKENLSLDDKKNLLNLIVNSALISTEAEREKLDQKPGIKAELQMLKSDLLTKEYIMTKIDPLVTVKDEEIEQIMKKNPSLVPKEMRTLKEIAVRTEKEADEIYQELKKGADFSKIATERSIAESKSKGGLIGTIPQGHLPPSLDSIAFQLKEGEYSQPIKTDEGFRILYLVDRKGQSSEEIKTIERKIREKVIQLEKKKKLEVLVQRKIEELKQKIKVETYFDQLR